LNRNIFLPGLKDVKINKVEICEHSIHLYVEMPVKPHRCPRWFLNNKEITKTIKEIGNKIIPAPIFKFYLLLLKAY